MIVKFLLMTLLTIIGGLDHFIFPALPSGVQSVLQTMLDYMGQGVRWVLIFFDRNLLSQLVVWWINIGILFLSYELIYHTWQLITGNASHAPANYESASDNNDTEKSS